MDSIARLKFPMTHLTNYANESTRSREAPFRGYCVHPAKLGKQAQKQVIYYMDGICRDCLQFIVHVFGCQLQAYFDHH